MKLLAIDPGTERSAYALIRADYTIVSAAKEENRNVLRMVREADYDVLAIECMQPRFLGGEKSPGQMIGAETYETCYMIGRCMQLAEGRGKDVQRVMRSEERAAIIPSKRNGLPPLTGGKGTTDARIREGLIARFARFDKKNGKGTSKQRDWFYGFHADMWAAYAVGVTCLDRLGREERT